VSGDDRGVVEWAADLAVFAPLGLALEARQLLPELAARGRRQVVFTRTVGKYAVRRGRQRVDDLVGTAVVLVSGLVVRGRQVEAETPADTTSPPPVARLVGPDIDAHHLAIPGYDSLSAFQVMPRLEALDPGDLQAVRDYEEATRGRRTILNKIAQLS
jgi:hypothetical protein